MKVCNQCARTVSRSSTGLCRPCAIQRFKDRTAIAPWIKREGIQ